MKKFRFFLSALALFLCSAVAFAQSTIKVTGVITDKDTHYELPGVAVQEKGSLANGILSSDDGSYTIRVAKDAVLVFTIPGYQVVEVPVSGRTEINVTLEIEASVLEGAVKIGYGSAKKIGNIVGNVTTVGAAVVKNAPVASALDLLQGQVAGMQVLSTGGVAGDNNISMKIHGVGSLGSSSEPLFIVDGIQSTKSAVMSMNPSDILNITVLSDASSTSIYGSQGANGVVYVTTKSGSFNRDATITVNSQYGISTLANEQFYKNVMSASELKNFWIRSGLNTVEGIKTSYTDKGYDADTQWYKYMQRMNNPQYQNDVTIEGGSDKIAYLLGASQFHQDGNTIGNYYDRYTVRSNIQAHPKEWLKAGVNLNLSASENMKNANWGSSSGNANYSSGGLSYLLNPLYPAIDPKTGEEYAIRYPNNIYNPHYYMDARHDSYDLYRLLGSAFVEVAFTKDLIFTSRVGTDAYYELRNAYLVPSSELANGSGQVLKTSYTCAKTTVNNTLEYSHTFRNMDDFSVLVGHEYIDYYYGAFTASNSGLTDDRYMSLDTPTKPENRSIGQSRTQYRFLSFFAQADYSHQDKYFVDFTIRNDASSRFGKNKRNGTFWAAGLMWKLANENFIREKYPNINTFNIKASYGTQGNALVGNYTHLGTISTLNVPYNGSTGIYFSSPSNEDITWENQNLATISLESRFYDKVDFKMSYYDRHTKDMLLSVPQPYTSGFTEVSANVGSMINRGIDLELGVDIINTKDAYLNARAVFSYNNEKVTELFNGLQRWEIANTMVAWVVGKPIMYYSPIYAGVDPEDGAPMWYLPKEITETVVDPVTGLEKEVTTIDKDVCTMDPNRVTKDFDEAYLTQNTGIRRHEPINGGFGISGRYKNLSVRADFAFVLKKYLFNNDAFFYANPNLATTDNQHKMVTDFWTPYHTNAKFPDWSKGYQMQFDTHLLEDASFLRLKTLVVAYNLPQNLLKSQKFFKSVAVTLTGRNLLTFTNYSGLDPEVDSNITVGIPGNTLQVLGGIELKF